MKSDKLLFATEPADVSLIAKSHTEIRIDELFLWDEV